MPDCPYCHQSIEAQAVSCPYCRTTLKAYGHPGIPLYRAASGEYLCQTCTYHEDNTCTFPQRPYAKECTLYHNQSSDSLSAQARPNLNLNRYQSIKLWVKQNAAWLILAGLILISLLLVLRQDNK